MPSAKPKVHGGARAGAGRKRAVLPPAIQDMIGPPPTEKPLELQRWYSKNLAVLLWLFETTGKHVQMLREVKSAASIVGRLMPLDVMAAAYRKIKSDEDELNEDEDPDEEVREVDGSRPRAVRRDAP